MNKIIENDGEKLDISNKYDREHVNFLVAKKIKYCVDNNRSVYYLPDFSLPFDVNKIMSIKSLLEDNNFNVLLFYNDFIQDSDKDNLNNIMYNLNKFNNSQIIRDY